MPASARRAPHDRVNSRGAINAPQGYGDLDVAAAIPAVGPGPDSPAGSLKPVGRGDTMLATVPARPPASLVRPESPGNATMAYKGVDLAHPRWVLARARRRSDPPGLDTIGTEFILKDETDFWGRLEQSLSPSSPTIEALDNVERSIKVVLESVRHDIDRRVYAGETKKELRVAFAFPYRTAPVVRRNLRNLIKNHLGEQPPENRSAIEAPIALALEGVAQKAIRVEAQAHVLLLTGLERTLELTAATLHRSGRTLRVEITAYAAIDPADIPGSVRDLGRSAIPGPLFHAGIPEVARAVDGPLRSRPGPSPVDLGPHATAIGALRHWGLLERQYWLEDPINAIEVTRIAPVALGILGRLDPDRLVRELDGEPPGPETREALRTSPGPAWCWRRLVEKGAPIPSPLALITEGPPPERIALAECPREDLAARQWLATGDWRAAGLRWHDVITKRAGHEGWGLQHEMSEAGQWRHLPYLIWKMVPEPARRPAPHRDGVGPAARPGTAAVIG